MAFINNIRMKKVLVLLLLLTTLMMSANDDKSLEKWVQGQQHPEYVDGMRIFRPVINKGKMTFGDFMTISTTASNNDAFVRALVYTINDLDPESEDIEVVDYDKHRFVVNRSLSTDDGHLYEFSEAIELDNGILSFMIPEIVLRYKDKLVINKKTLFSKLKPDEKEAHSKFVEEFSLLNSRYLSQMAEAATHSTIDMVSDWVNVKKGKAAKGMNFTEVLLTEGKPDTITESGELVKWMYGSTMIIIFNRAKVERIVYY